MRAGMMDVVNPTEDLERCYRAVRSRDARFDGVFYTAVRTTGIYCRPSCPAVTPKPQNVTFYVTSAAAHEAGYRACRRCRPDTTPGSPDWNVRGDAVGRAMQLIRDGVVEREGVGGLARRLGYTQRHVTRILHAELGAGPLALARVARAQTARVLVETTTLPFGEIAFASGFASVRQFNDTMRGVYALTPTAMRDARGTAHGRTGGRLRLRLAVRPPFAAGPLLEFLNARAVPGVETVDDGAYARVLRLPRGTGAVSLRPAGDHVTCTLEVQDLRDTAVAVQRCRALLDLDADPVAIRDTLGEDRLLAPLVRRTPGLRLPGHVDGFELAVRAILGQQVSVAGARTTARRIVENHGAAVPSGLAVEHRLTHAFPTPQALAGADPSALGVPRQRGRAITALATAVAAGELDLDPGADRVALREQLVALPGIGPWTAGYVAMRAASDPDVFLDGDLIVRHELAALGCDTTRARRWRPWRSYAVMHLWRAAGSRSRR
ncbi:MAG: AlkA N-terminal domain-containing protein [Nocardioidaceae bacterium]